MKVGDKVRVISVGTAGLRIGTNETIACVYDEGTPSEWYDVSSGWAYAKGELELIKPEPKGQCLPDAAQELYTALKVLLTASIKVETHLITHPYQRALVGAIHVAQEAIDKAENGEPAEVKTGCGECGCAFAESVYGVCP